ncbi:MAG: ATP-binding cassette domain-containing protein, partial [Elusimicrobiota bacterium]|nr:ATP-binding cassette domain-containing protein [Elusimicrobiota bacterium]
MIRLEGLGKTFGSYTAVSDLDLEVRPGEIFGFLGPNGAGKTTTVKMMTGLLRPTFGRVLIGGIDLAADPIAAKRAMGLVPDEP